MATMTGCGSENEAEFNAQASKTSNVELKEPVTTPVSNQADWGKSSAGGTAGGDYSKASAKVKKK